MADSLYPGEYPQPLSRSTNLACPVFPSKVTGRLRLQQIPVPSVAGVAATLSTNLTGSNNDLIYTARDFGTAGNSTTVAYADPGGNNAALSVSVSSAAITVNLATGSGGAITSTAAQVKAAIEASAAASALVSVALKTSNDGTGVVTALSATNLAGGVNPVAAPGFDTQVVVENTGSVSVSVRLRECDSYAAASPRWTLNTSTIVAGGQKSFNVAPTMRYLEVYGTSGKGQVRLQLVSKLRWDDLAFQKTDTTYPVELYQPVSLPAVDGSSY